MKQFKKALVVILCVLCLTCLAFCVTACNPDSVDGKSAYQIWLDNGNTGTETDFLNWLKGKDGKDGANGQDGKDGANGQDGKDGVNGKDGLNGADGKDGANGSDGKDGANGADGKDGANGADGKDGANGQDGVDGKSAYELYKEKYGYNGTEEEWLFDLVNGKLALKEKYTVTFDSDGGSEVESQEVSDGKKATEPDAPTKTGYTFGGWYVKSSEWNFLSYTVTENMTLKAKWFANEYTLKFNSNGGNDIADMAVRYNEDYMLPSPIKENYIFIGWRDGETAYEQSGRWQKTSGAELTAEWVIAKSTITFEANNGSIVSPMTVDYGADYMLPVVTKENFAFIGWFLGGQKFEGSTLLTGDITLFAKWKSVTETFGYTETNGEITLTEFLGGVTEVVIPATINGVAVTKLADGIFRSNTDIVSVTFDGGFENYDAKLFAGCSSLKRLVLSGTYNKALYYLFGDSINDIPESFVEISFAKNSLYFNSTIFRNKVANHIVTYVIPDGTTKILSNQFDRCIYMQAVCIPNSVTSIGDSAFYGCSGLTSVTIGSGVTSIGYNAFYGCTGLTKVNYLGTIDQWAEIGFGTSDLVNSNTPLVYARNLYINNKLVTKVKLTTATKISPFAFCNCSGLTSVTIPDSVTSIGRGAFYNSGLTSIYYTGDVAGWCGIKGLGNIMSYSRTLYIGGKKVEGDLVIPDSVTSIGWGAFYNCSGLTSVTIGSGVTSIGYNAFYGCTGLTKVTIPDSVTSIGRGAFV